MTHFLLYTRAPENLHDLQINVTHNQGLYPFFLFTDLRLLRERLSNIPELRTEGLRDCQIMAISNLEKSFKDNRPRALVQMATGSGKTYTAITSVYRLLKHADAKRVLF